MVINLKDYKKRKYINSQKLFVEQSLQIMYTCLNELRSNQQSYSFHNIRTTMDCLQANIRDLENKLLLWGDNGSKGKDKTRTKE